MPALKVNIVSKDKNWILDRGIKELLSRYPKNFVLNQPGDFDFTYFVPYDRFKKTSGKSVSLFTHLESTESTNDPKYTDRKRSQYLEAAKESDHCLTMSVRSSLEFFDFTGRASDIVTFGVSKQKKITFGVCGRTYKSGRKNEHYARQLKEAGINICSWGSPDWGVPEVHCEYSTIDKFFYSKIDYLIITSGQEGGPVPFLEALALGVPVIAPDVGWCWEYPCIKYARNDFESLLWTCRKLSEAPSWQQWADKHLFLFQSYHEKN